MAGRCLLFIPGAVLLGIFIGWWTFHAKPDRKSPRISREVDSLRLRFHDGLESLYLQRSAGRDEAPDDSAFGFEETEINPGSTKSSLREWIWTLPSEVLPAADFYEFSEIVVAGWAPPALYPHRGSGGGGSRFEFSFGDSRTYAVALMTAFEANGRTTIHSRTLAVAAPTANDGGEARAGNDPAASVESIYHYRVLFIRELASRCAPYGASAENPRMRERYTFERPGSGVTSPGIREQSWQWVVPEEVLKPDGLRAFSDEIRAEWNSGYKPLPGEDYSYTLLLENGTRQALVSIVAIPRPPSGNGGSAETTLHYYQLFLDGAARKGDVIDKSKPLDHEALAKVPGSKQRERLANAKLDGDGRMLKSLRKSDRIYEGTWKLEYNLRFPDALPEATVESFATSHGMTWKASSYKDPRQDVMRHVLRFFKVMEFSEDEIQESTAAVRRFCDDHGGHYIGWNFKSDKIRKRDDP